MGASRGAFLASSTVTLVPLPDYPYKWKRDKEVALKCLHLMKERR